MHGSPFTGRSLEYVVQEYVVQEKSPNAVACTYKGQICVLSAETVEYLSLTGELLIEKQNQVTI